MISAFDICLLESIISRLAMKEISIFWLFGVAEQAGLNLTLPETPETVFCCITAHIESANIIG